MNSKSVPTMRDSEANMKESSKTYAIVEVIDGENIQLVRLSVNAGQG